MSGTSNSDETMIMGSVGATQISPPDPRLGQEELRARWIRYEVVRVHWFWYEVQRTVQYGSSDSYADRYTVKGYLTMKRAAAHAQGLAGGSWTNQGPILYSYEKAGD